ncbi:MAG: CPBP family intramembrane metalloprotease [Lachnospiraceae bacterium]|nr:CPBP family intramembrane metalloprotease [Lachnospiraceae bacterium]
MNWILYVLSPVAVHLIVAEGTVILMGNHLDSAACTALSAFLVLPAAIWMYRQDGALHKAAFHRASFHKEALSLLLCLLSGGLLNVLWSSFLNWAKISTLFSNQTQEELLASARMMQIAGPGFLVPIAEELIFRGLVYTRMKARLSVWQAALLSALLFALYHGNPIQMIYAFPMALILALLYEWSGTLAYPILFHMGANLAAILL